LFLSGETPSKRRRLSSDTSELKDTKDKVLTEPGKAENDNLSGDKVADEKMDCASTSDPKSSKVKSEVKPEPKKVERSRSSSGPDIKESLGSPRPVTRPDSPEPGTSGADDKTRRTSQDEGSSSGQKQSSSEDDTPRPRPRERPMWVDIVAKHIESLFSLLSKSATEG